MMMMMMCTPKKLPIVPVKLTLVVSLLHTHTHTRHNPTNKFLIYLGTDIPGNSGTKNYWESQAPVRESRAPACLDGAEVS